MENTCGVGFSRAATGAAVLVLVSIAVVCGCENVGDGFYEQYNTFLIHDLVTGESILCCEYPYPPDMQQTVEPRCPTTWRCDPRE